MGRAAKQLNKLPWLNIVILCLVAYPIFTQSQPTTSPPDIKRTENNYIIGSESSKDQPQYIKSVLTEKAIPGPKGEKGEQGATGPQGEKGLTPTFELDRKTCYWYVRYPGDTIRQRFIRDPDCEASDGR